MSVYNHEHYDGKEKEWYGCNCIKDWVSPEAPPEGSCYSSPDPAKAPFQPSNVSAINRNDFIDAIEQLRVSLDRSMKTIEARIDLIEARLHHIKELLVHPVVAPTLVASDPGKPGSSFYMPREIFDPDLLIRKPGDTKVCSVCKLPNCPHPVTPVQPPSPSRTHECHRGLTYREELLLARMNQSAEEVAGLRVPPPIPGEVEVKPGKLGRVHTSNQ